MSNTGPIETQLTVVTWNLWWQFGPWQDRAPLILQTLREQDADIIALQEIWGDEAESSAKVIANALGYHYYTAQSMVMNNTGFGNAILSRWPILDHDVLTLFGNAKTGETRNVIYTLVDGPRGQLAIFNTHPNHKLEQSNIRQRQVTDIAEFIAEKPTQRVPSILCGDFNADPDSDEIRMLTGHAAVPVEGLVFNDAWRSGGDGTAGFTWDCHNPYTADSYEPSRRIDYIFVGKAKARGRGHVVNCRIIGNQPTDNIWPSDHYGLCAKLRY